MARHSERRVLGGGCNPGVKRGPFTHPPDREKTDRDRETLEQRAKTQARKVLAEEKWCSIECYSEALAQDVLALLERLEAAEREPYRVVWEIVDKLGLNEGGGCPDSRIINEVKRLRAKVGILERPTPLAHRIEAALAIAEEADASGDLAGAIVQIRLALKGEGE